MPETHADYDIEWDDEPLPKLEPPKPRPVTQADRSDRDLAVVQARAAQAEGAEVSEGVVTDTGKVELLGKHFRVAEKIGLMPLLKFATAADMLSDDPQALVALYCLLKDCIYEGSPACGECADCQAGNETACKSYDK